MSSCWSPVTFFGSVEPHIFAWATSFMFLFTVAVTSTIALSYGHVSGFPYISDMGTTVPESSIFGLFLSIYSVLLGITVWNVYNTAPVQTTLSGWACIFGFGAAFGVEIVANFQETVIFYAHMSGAMLAFSMAVTYMWVHTIINSRIRYFRFFCATSASLTMVTTSLTGMAALAQFKGTSMPHWGPNDGGYTLHAVSVVTEWATASFINIFIFTLAKDIQLSDEHALLRNWFTEGRPSHQHLHSVQVQTQQPSFSQNAATLETTAASQIS